ncbi:MAG: hypothetical protein WC915_03605 [archaeon]|jgi:hypothetical protein
MAKIVNGKIILTNEESLLLKDNTEFELIPNQKGIFLLIEKDVVTDVNHITCFVDETDMMKIDKIELEVINKIRTAKLSDLVEGKFELTLNPEQKKALTKLIKEEKIILFKLNETYKKGVYKIAEEKKETIDNTPKESENFNAPTKLLPDYNLQKDGFISTTNTERARILSSEYKEQIESNNLRGIKSFEGVYYLISNALIEKHLGNLIKILEKEKELTIEELAKKENISIELTKIICEFLKEDGELLEKQKGKYKYIN